LEEGIITNKEFYIKKIDFCAKASDRAQDLLMKNVWKNKVDKLIEKASSLSIEELEN